MAPTRLSFSSPCARRKEGVRLAPFHVERLDYRTQDSMGFFKELERSGPRAVREFGAAFGYPPGYTSPEDAASEE